MAVISHPSARITSYPYWPKWTSHASGNAGQRATGHGAAVLQDGNGTGEDVLFRARYTATGNGIEAVAIRGTDLDTPQGWESLWPVAPQITLTSTHKPEWEQNGDRGATLDVVVNGNGFRVFFFDGLSGDIKYADFNINASVTAGPTTIMAEAGGTTNALVLCAISPTEIFYSETKILDNGLLAPWHKPVYGSSLTRLHNPGTGWQADTSFPFLTHAEWGLCRDGPDMGSDFSDGTSATNVISQLGYRPHGGLAGVELDSDTVVLLTGATFWRKFGQNTHSQGVLSFLFHRDSGWWERGLSGGGVADYTTDLRLHYSVFARASTIDGRHIVIWNYLAEPGDFIQQHNKINIPRQDEVVLAVLDESGHYLTQEVYLGLPSDFTAAKIVSVQHAGKKTLYALGYKAVASSPAADLLCDVPDTDSLDLSKYCDGFTVTKDAQGQATARVMVTDASIVYSNVEAGNKITIDAGETGQPLTRVISGYVDYITPTIASNKHGAVIAVRGDKALLDAVAEGIEDILPQNIIRDVLPAPGTPNPVAKHITYSNGLWELGKGSWDTHYFADAYGMAQEYVYRCRSFPFAPTGGNDPEIYDNPDTPQLAEGGPGSCLDAYRPQHMGTWYKDIVWLGSAALDSVIQARVRFGDVNNATTQFAFSPTWDGGHGPTYQTVHKTAEGIILGIKWHYNGYNGTIWNPNSQQIANGMVNGVAQEACAAGLICRSPEIGKKYIFMWESSTRADSSGRAFSLSSHVDDTFWTGENFDRADFSDVTLGDNKLYLIISDYDESDPDWEANNKWLHKAVRVHNPVGLTRGKPADLRMQVLGGTIYCYYRPAPEAGSAPQNWALAFTYPVGRFGAGKFGLVGRGHAGIHWDVLWPGREQIANYDNYADFWNINLTDTSMDRTIEDVLRQYSWYGHTKTSFDALAEEATVSVAAGSYHTLVDANNIPVPTTNTVIDFDVSIPPGGEAGVIIRGVDPNAPDQDCVRIGIVQDDINTYTVKRMYANGIEDTALVEYAPVPIPVPANKKIHVRVVARDDVYSIWIFGNYAGHFIESTEMGLYTALYATQNTTFWNVRIPELYEVPEYALLDTGQRIQDAIDQLINKRNIRRRFLSDGSLHYSYYDNRVNRGTLENTLVQSSLRISDRFVSRVTVEGAYTKATATSLVLLAKGERYETHHMPDIYHHEHCYREARKIIQRKAEEMVRATFTGVPDYTLLPEDTVTVIVNQQGINGEYIIENVTYDFSIRGKRATMSLATRQTFLI